MKKLCIFKRGLILFGLTLLLASSCAKGDVSGDSTSNPIPNDPTVLNLTYDILGSEEGVATYALPAEPDECRINDIYTLFFRAASHGDANKYVGYTRSAATASGNTGTSRVTLPAGEDVQDEWQLVFVANLDLFANLEGAVDVDTWLIAKLTGKTLAQAKPLLTAIANKPTGLKSPFLMSGELTKLSGSNIASVTLSRAVSRIDVINSASKFVLESGQVWSGRTLSYILPNVGSMTGTAASDFIHYSGNDVLASGVTGNISAGLYAFENFVAVPTITDHTTTCLILKGRYDGGPSSYYRVNISPKSGQQMLKRNSVYSINITTVTSDGELDPGDAFDQSQLKIDYTINEWDDSFNGTYVFDRHGNGLAVSSRTVVFSEKGGQSTQLEVFTIDSKSNPIVGSWSVGGIVGADAAEFTAAKVDVPADRYFTVGTATNNETTADRDVVVEITWGGITVPVSVKQLNPTSMMDGLSVTPNDIWFPKVLSTREVCVNLQGNFTGVTRADIQTSILYGAGATGWLSMLPGTTADNPALGLYYYTVQAITSTGTLREAGVKFVVTQGTKVMTSQINITQTTYEVGEGFLRQMNVNILERIGTTNDYLDKGNLADRYLKFKGLPVGQDGDKHLHFAIVESETLKYRMDIASSMAWKIVVSGNAAVGLVFSKMSDPGDLTSTKTLEITAKSDVSAGWDGIFHLEYENGDRVEFTVHQQGVLSTLDRHTTSDGTSLRDILDGNIYYYGTFLMNGKLWLDRNLGATSDGYFTNRAPTVNPEAKGVYIRWGNAEKSCPPGFTLPGGRDQPLHSWKWVADNMTWSGLNGNAEVGGISNPYSFYITYSSNPVKRWIIPISGRTIAGNITTPTDIVGFYWTLRGVGTNFVYLYLNPTSPSSYLSDFSNEVGAAHAMSVRCVQK